MENPHDPASKTHWPAAIDAQEYGTDISIIYAIDHIEAALDKRPAIKPKGHNKEEWLLEKNITAELYAARDNLKDLLNNPAYGVLLTKR